MDPSHQPFSPGSRVGPYLVLEKLGEGGKTSQCGWLDDKFDVTWQIVPDILGKYLSDPNKTKANNVMAAMMKMTKMDISKLQAAYDQV